VVSMKLENNPRQRRLHRTRAASFLVALNAPCSRNELQSISWDSLTHVPHWCFMDAATRRYLQLLCGAFFAGPSMLRWIDGVRIQSACDLLGERAFARVLAMVDEQIEPAIAEEPGVEQLFLTGGAAVLTGAVPDPAIQTLLRAVFQPIANPLPMNVAQPLYALALSLFDDEIAAMNAASVSA